MEKGSADKKFKHYCISFDDALELEDEVFWGGKVTFYRDTYFENGRSVRQEINVGKHRVPLEDIPNGVLTVTFRRYLVDTKEYGIIKIDLTDMGGIIKIREGVLDETKYERCKGKLAMALLFQKNPRKPDYDIYNLIKRRQSEADDEYSGGGDGEEKEDSEELEPEEAKMYAPSAPVSEEEFVRLYTEAFGHPPRMYE